MTRQRATTPSSPQDRERQIAEARRVAIGFGGALSVLTLVSYVTGRPRMAGVCAGVAVLVALGAVFRLSAWIVLSRLLGGLAVVMARVGSRLILCLVFYGVLTPVGLLGRLLGRRPLDTAWKDGRPSYWREPRMKPSTVSRHRKQH
jgi:hypothetical protein